jgi:hypothetical protein
MTVSPCSAVGDKVLATTLLKLFHPEEEINFKHFNAEGGPKKGVKRVINNTTTVKIS